MPESSGGLAQLMEKLASITDNEKVSFAKALDTRRRNWCELTRCVIPTCSKMFLARVSRIR